MCLWSIGFARSLGNDIGCRFVVLVTKGDHRVVFYTKCGFQECKVKLEENNVLMYHQLEPPVEQ
jgi:hypothetical protein